MFNPKTDKIRKLYEDRRKTIDQLKLLLVGKVGVYIDYANVRPWSTKLGWNIDLKRLKQFLDSFDNIESIKIYSGTLYRDKISEKNSKGIKKIFKDNFKTKPVKIINHSVDYTSIKSTSTDLLEKFIRKCLVKKYEVGTIEYLNEKFKEMNQK